MFIVGVLEAVGFLSSRGHFLLKVREVAFSVVGLSSLLLLRIFLTGQTELFKLTLLVTQLVRYHALTGHKFDVDL